MKKIVFTLALITAVVFSVAITACSDDNTEQNPVVGDRFTLALSADRQQTRAVSEEPGETAFNENRIDRIDIFFYNGTALAWHATGADIIYDTSTQQVVIQVPADKRSIFNGTIDYDIYVVANNTADLTSIAEGETNLDALRNLTFRTNSFETAGGNEAQTSFVMDGVISGIAANLNSPDLGAIDLKRAAAKVRLALMNVDVEGYTYTAETAQARLVHFTDQSVLTDGGTPYNPATGEWRNTAFRNLSGSAPDGESTAAPFYAYANDWSGDETKETYIELRIPLVNNSTSDTEQHLYRVPLTPYNPDAGEASHVNKMERNFLYDIKVAVNMPGGIEEQPVTVSANYEIKNWSTREILVDIKASHYLVVSENEVIMPNIANYMLRFNSSIPDVTLVPNSLKATYTYVNHSNGQPDTVIILPGDDDNQYPAVTVSPGVAEGEITIESVIPVNFIPKDIEFKVTNGPLTETVTIRQLPAIYFTAERGERSNLRDELPSHLNNQYMYIITSLAPAGDIVWGFPPVDGDGRTENSAETANMVSPRFMMASQLGATDVMNYNNAATNCANYWEETIVNGQTVRYSDWRLPTEAEIRYLDDLQHSRNNPIGLVMTGRYYWDAYSVNGSYRLQDGSSGSLFSAHTRCIRDIKD